MKNIIFLFLMLNIICLGDTIDVINGKIKSIDVRNIPSKYIEKFTITEPYESRIHTFEGISLKSFTQLYGSNPQSITITAIDYFESKFTAEDIQNPNLIFVIKQDGKYLTPLEKGPARMIDKSFQMKNKKLTLFDQWVWMIQEIRFK